MTNNTRFCSRQKNLYFKIKSKSIAKNTIEKYILFFLKLIVKFSKSQTI